MVSRPDGHDHDCQSQLFLISETQRYFKQSKKKTFNFQQYYFGNYENLEISKFGKCVFHDFWHGGIWNADIKIVWTLELCKFRTLKLWTFKAWKLGNFENFVSSIEGIPTTPQHTDSHPCTSPPPISTPTPAPASHTLGNMSGILSSLADHNTQ